MPTNAGPRIVEVAEQILADIRRRKLRPGQAYLGTAETAQWLHTSGTTVNRALQLLAQRGVVQRRQRQGTIVLDPAGRKAESTLQRVHLLVSRDYLRAEGLWSDGVLLGLQGALPGVELQFNFRPAADEAEYVEELLLDILRARQAAGLILIRSSVATQRVVAASGLPAVVSGMLQPSVRGLPSIDRDQRKIGELLAQHLLAQRCRRYLVLLRERQTTGDHAMLDGAFATLGAAGVPLSAVTLRALPTDTDVVVAETAAWLEADPATRAGCLCRSEALARAVDQAADSLRLRGKRRPEIAVADAAPTPGAKLRYPSTEPAITAEAWGGLIGGMLAAAARRERPVPYQQLVPVRLVLPG